MTAPALPGAAPDPAPGRNDPARLPPEVDAAIVEAVLAATNFGVDGRLSDLQKSQDAVVALRTAIARALGGDGEPVAWGVFDKNDCLWRSFDSQRDAERESASLNAREDTGHYRACGPYRVVPLYTHPTAPVAPTVDAALAALAADGLLDAVRAAHRAEVDALKARLAHLTGANETPTTERDDSWMDTADPDALRQALKDSYDMDRSHHVKRERAVREAVEQEREACARIVRAFREQYEPGDDARLTLEQAEHDILARGAKS